MATIVELTTEAEHKMQKSIEASQHEFSTLRTGRAHPGMLDGILVEAYGSQMPIGQLAQVHVPEPRQLTITPYDRSTVGAIERAIKMSDLNINPINDGAGIRLNLPPLTEERRKDMVKLLHKKAEEGRVAIRNVRREANDHFKQLEKKSEASEDESKRAQEKLQKLTDKYIADLDQLQKAKEAELLEV
ncbi:MAG: ribosome recycling factor [Capsulimonadaceae bacterium]|nr:ribosome recycling factor [Capsulimonadaceae bacterium]